MTRLIAIGPLNVPLWGLTFVGAYLAGLLTVYLVLRSNRAIRHQVSDLFSTAILIGFLVWKLLPGLLSIRTVFSQPLYLLYATGGPLALVAGAGAAILYFVLALRKRWPGSRDDRHAVMRGVIGFSGAVLTVFLVGALSSIMTIDRSEDLPPEAPDFTLRRLSGEEASLSDYRGRRVIINFWATWCPPCRAEMPLLVSYDAEARADAGKPILVSVNQTGSERSLDALIAFVDDHQIEFPIFLDPDNRVFAAFGVRGIPTTVVVDTDGTIIARRTGVVTQGWLDGL